MASLKEIRTRIVSVKTTRQVTSAMKMVSAAKLKKAQDAILQIRPYAEKFYQILGSLGANLENVENSVYMQPRHPENVLVILIASNRGLCGGFNANISKKAAELVVKFQMTALVYRLLPGSDFRFVWQRIQQFRNRGTSSRSGSSVCGICGRVS